MGPRASKCRLCGAPIYWARHRSSGKLTCIDASPSEGGNLLIVQAGYAGELEIVQVGGPYPAGRNRWVDHHATCKPHIERLESARALKRAAKLDES